MTQKLEKLSTKDSTELIIYQVGEVKNLLENMNLRFDNFQDKTDRRITALELFQASEVAKAQVQISVNKTDPKIDIQKIILAAFALISTVVSIALGLNQAR